jgi:hypothetical protein
MSSLSDFGKKQLEKFGWTKGQGLGSNQQGITKPISVAVKQDTIGLGHSTEASKNSEWNFTWWDHVFNKTASQIQVSVSLLKSQKTK